MLVLLRHGESEGNAARQLVGRNDSPLTDRGRAQAAAMAGALGTVGRLISSPLARARTTAAALALDLPVEVDERWIEIDYGRYDGEPLGAVPAEVWTRWRADPDFRPPGERRWWNWGPGCGRRARSCSRTPARAARADADVVVVSHVSPIKAAVAWALGVGDEVAWRLFLATGSITRIGWGVDGPVLHRYNETPIQDAP